MKETSPVKIWAAIGGVVLAFQCYVIAKWIAGPYFTPVDVGPSEVPQWMMFSIRSMEAGFVILWIWCLWNYIVQPYRKQGRIGADGLMCVAFTVYVWFQDPIADYGGPAFTYNAALFNMGSWLNEVPGVLCPGRPGAQLPEPLWTGALYSSIVFLIAVFGAWLMRRIKRQFPGLNNLQLIGAMFVCMVTTDIVLEGFILMPLGAYTFAGAPDWGSINVTHYYKFPLVEGFAFGAAWTCWASLLYFKDDRGLTVVERGIEQLTIPDISKTFVRFLAIGGFVAMSMGLFVSIPWFWLSSHMSTYPEDIQQRSYFTNGFCGEGTNQACFGPAIPNSRGNTSARIGPHGELVGPAVALPKFVPFDHGPQGPKGD